MIRPILSCLASEWRWLSWFLLMTGPASTPTTFEPDIFSVRRIKVAPVVCLLGFVFMIYAVLRKPKGSGAGEQ